ncbi:activating transcription factor 3 isoform X2 [Nasonia vitripennis]|uniref:BZIP domain-containing protein n=1 Tax=Nasonia vitripennis TaxID=7425 RepID=A0A7M7IWF2_NASVI|nr:activating transcription factor 3 isoform X2 [Nasonia vitripennis]
MYNLNVNVNANPAASAAGLLSVAAAAAEVTPRTPEIVNSLIAMSNPFDSFGSTVQMGSNGSARSRDRADSSSSGEPSPPSVQHTCSQLIKEGLKLTLQTKRRANGSADEGKKRSRKEYGSADDEEDDESSNSKTSNGLTPEDEERRKRRRERNKIAATKCRLKKREKTNILVNDCEHLEKQNNTLKSQVQVLETELHSLVEMFNRHGPTCLKQAACPETYHQQYADPVGPLPSYQENFVANSHQQNQPSSDCSIVSDYGPVKIEGFEAVAQDFYRQGSPYTAAAMSTTTTTTTTNPPNAGCTV